MCFCAHDVLQLGSGNQRSGLALLHCSILIVSLGISRPIFSKIIPSSPIEVIGAGRLMAPSKEKTNLGPRKFCNKTLVEELAAVPEHDPHASCGRVVSMLAEQIVEQ